MTAIVSTYTPYCPNKWIYLLQVIFNEIIELILRSNDRCDDRFLLIYAFDYKMSKPNDQILDYLNKVDLIENNLYHFDK